MTRKTYVATIALLGRDMGISKYPSKLSLPILNPGVSTVLEYLIVKFPRINPDIWQQRVETGKVHWHDGSLITAQSAYRPQQRVYYYREVESEPVIPFSEQILFQDEHILLAYKPHFLQVTPGGIYINECLQNRLRLRCGNDQLQALHRLDRATAGLVLFSLNSETRNLYHNLFETRQIQKTYQAVAKIGASKPVVGDQWCVKNRIENGQPRFLMEVVEGVANSHSKIRCLNRTEQQALFELTPVTGRTHQLRVHMQTLGWPILNDRYYPILTEKSADNYAQPLQLLAKELRFIDPISAKPRTFSCEQQLSLQ